MRATEATIRVLPAHQARWEDLQTVFGARGQARRCQCQRYKLAAMESFASFPEQERADRLRQQTQCGNPPADRTSGLVAYAGDEPAGWCAVEPRAAYPGLVRNSQVPWLGRTEDKSDPTVWAVTCLLTRVGFRRQGISRALVSASVEHARTHGARALEAYPVTTTDVLDQELHVGLESVFAAAGFTVVSRPTLRRRVMRVPFTGD